MMIMVITPSHLGALIDLLVIGDDTDHHSALGVRTNLDTAMEKIIATW
jgi:hypothetical protein